MFNEAYRKALKDGEARNDRIPVMIIGQDRSGKTSLRKRLLGLPFDPIEPSTIGINVDIVKVTSETSKEAWVPSENERILTSEKIAMEKVNEKVGILLKHKTMDTQEKTGEAKENYSFPQVSIAPIMSKNFLGTVSSTQSSNQQLRLRNEIWGNVPATEVDCQNTPKIAESKHDNIAQNDSVETSSMFNQQDHLPSNIASEGLPRYGQCKSCTGESTFHERVVPMDETLPAGFGSNQHKMEVSGTSALTPPSIQNNHPLKEISDDLLDDSFDAIRLPKQNHTAMDATPSVAAGTCLQENQSMQKAYLNLMRNQRCPVERSVTTQDRGSSEQGQKIGNLTSTAMALNEQNILTSGETAKQQLIDEISSSALSSTRQCTSASDVSTSDQLQSKPIRKTLPPTHAQGSRKTRRKMNSKRKNAKKLSATQKERIMHHRDIGQNQESDAVRIIVHDLAGQAIYYDTHSLFLKPHAPYVLCHDLTKDLDETAEPRFKSKLEVDLKLRNPLLQNNLDYLLCWLNFLGQLGETEKKQNADFSLPPVVIVLTNKDRFKGDVESVKERIKDVTEGKFQNLFANVHVIDNTTTSGSEDPVGELRCQIFSLCKAILAEESPMPIRWLKFEGALSEVAFSGKKSNYIPVQEAKKIAEECGIESFRNALTFLHRQGVVVYYQGYPYVVLNPPWLMNLFTEVITVPENPEDSKPIDAPYYRKLRKEGVLEKEFLMKHPHGELLEDLMQRVSLMCPLERKGKTAFFVPSVAPLMKKGKEIMPMLQASPIASLFIMFFVGFIPLGVFTRFQVKLVKACKDILRVDQPKLYCNYTLLPISFSDIKFDVYLIQLIEKIKIAVLQRDKLKNKECLPEFACYLKKQLRMCLDNIKSDDPMSYRGLRYDFAVKCTACIEVSKEERCRHGKLKCEHDECGHMHLLTKIQKCSGDSLYCNVDETKSLEFDLKRVKPWLDTGKLFLENFVFLLNNFKSWKTLFINNVNVMFKLFLFCGLRLN